MSEQQQKPIDNLSFEDALGELESIVRNLETGSASLEDSIALYERGSKLKSHCETKLKNAQEKIEKIVISQNNTPTTQPFETEE